VGGGKETTSGEPEKGGGEKRGGGGGKKKMEGRGDVGGNRQRRGKNPSEGAVRSTPNRIILPAGAKGGGGTHGTSFGDSGGRLGRKEKKKKKGRGKTVKGFGQLPLEKKTHILVTEVRPRGRAQSPHSIQLQKKTHKKETSGNRKLSCWKETNKGERPDKKGGDKKDTSEGKRKKK